MMVNMDLLDRKACLYAVQLYNTAILKEGPAPFKGNKEWN